MTFPELFSKLADLPSPDEEEFPSDLMSNFSSAKMDDLKMVALAQVPEEFSDEDVSNAAVQAYRIIAMRGSAEDLPIFMEILSTWDGLYVEEVLREEFPWVMEQLGGEVVPVAQEILKQAEIPELHRGLVLEGLETLLEDGLEVEAIQRGCVEQLCELRPERLLNGFLIDALVKHSPGQFHDEILAAYEANVVDVTIVGDCEDMEIDLGLRTERETPARNLGDLEEELLMLSRKETLGEFPDKGDVFEKVDYVVQLYRQEGGVSSASMLDGVYAAAICSPVMVQPAALFMLPWDLSKASPESAPKYSDQKEAARVSSALMNFYNEINTGIDKLKYVPSIPYYENEDDVSQSRAHPESWLFGLFMGASYVGENLGENDYTEKISKMAMDRLLRIEKGETFDVESVVELVSPMIEALLLARHQEKERMAESMAAGNFTPGSTEQVVRTDAKVGRNDPCPCGSGRKFKKCCAN